MAYELQSKKVEALSQLNLLMSERYREGRKRWICLQLSIFSSSECAKAKLDDVKSYIDEHCPCEPSEYHKSINDPDRYTGALSLEIRRMIRKLSLFIDIVQTNGGFCWNPLLLTREEEARRRNRIRKQLMDGGISSAEVDVYFKSKDIGLSITANGKTWDA